MILDLTDFLDREYKIPNQNESRDLEAFIEKHEKEILKELLGYELFAELEAALESSAELEDRWVDLRDGAEYTYNDKTYKWLGLVDLLKPAVYSRWINVGTYKFTNVGFVQNNAQQQSATLEDMEPFIVRAWNEFVLKVGYNYEQRFGTLYGFMKANEADYDGWCFTEQKFKNRHSL